MRQARRRSIALRQIIFTGALLCLIIFSQPRRLHAQESAAIFIQNAAGGNATQSSLQLTATVGQAAPIGTASSGRFQVLGGHVYALDLSPSISHTPLSIAVGGQDISIDANLTDDTGVANVALVYRRGGERDSTRLAMAKSGDSYRGAIAANAVTSRGVEYYLLATDSVGNHTRQPATGVYSVQVALVEPGLVQASAQPHGTSVAAYLLFSVPLDLDNKNPATVLADDLGEYQNTKWRFWELRPNQTYREFPNTAALAPGKAFWLLVKEAGKIIDTGAGKSNPTNKSFAIALHPQWNFIGNPFDFTIPVRQLRLKSGKQTPELLQYRGAWSNPLTEKVETLDPFAGYAIYNDSSTSDTLFIDPKFSATSASNPAAIKPLWAVTIRAQGAQAFEENIMAVVASASSTWDAFDSPQPPPIDASVALSFPHPEWNKLATNFRVDARPEPAEGEVWEFEVASDNREPIQFTFAGIENVPPEFEVWLMEETLQIASNLREERSYAIAGFDAPKRLQVVVGKTAFVRERLRAARLQPAAYELAQNFPNPFNPVTTIQYGLPQASRVTLKIFTLLGEEAATLIDGEFKAAGYHVAVWNGRDRRGRQMASGIYLLKLQAGGFTFFKKMVMSK